MAWPLGTPLITGYSIGLESPVIETQMEQGPLRTQRISNSYQDIISISVIATDAELTSFRTWYNGTEAKLGAGWFDLNLKTSSGTQVAHSVRIVRGSVSVTTRNDVRWQISMQVETQEHLSA